MLRQCNNKEFGFGCPTHRIEIGFGFRQKLNVWVLQWIKTCDSSRLLFHNVIWKSEEPVASIFRSASCIFSPHCLTFKLGEAVRHMSSSFSFMHIATKVEENWLIWLDVLWLSNWNFCLSRFVCFLVLNFQILCRQTQRKPKNTVYLSTFSNFCGILQSCRLCCCAFQPFSVSWVTLRGKSTAYWSCCSAKLCFCSFSTKNN